MTTNPYHLAKGAHDTSEEGRCAMEWISYIAGEPHSDRPVCVSPVLREFGMSLNDQWDDEQRQKLRPYLARCIGTAGDGRDEERGWLAMDWLVREFTPAFLDLVPALRPHADGLRGLSPLRAPEALDDAMVLLRNAQKDSHAARHAAGHAAGHAAWDAARDAAGHAARHAAWDAARAAAWDAARDAARDAAGHAARHAAWDAAWDAARDAAGHAAGHAAWGAAWGAAGHAARHALQPTVTRLQAAALDLFDRMLPTIPLELPVLPEQARELTGVEIGA